MSLVDIPDVPLRQIFQYLDIKTVGLMTCTSSSIHNFIVNNNVLCRFHKNIHKLTIKVMGNENDEYSENLDENAIEVRLEVNRRTPKLFRFLPDSSWETSKDDVVETYEDEKEFRIFSPLHSEDFLFWLGNVLSNSAIDSIQLEEFCLNEKELARLECEMKKRNPKTGLLLLADYFNHLTWNEQTLVRFFKLINVTLVWIDKPFMRTKQMPETKSLQDLVSSEGINLYLVRPRCFTACRPPLTTSFDGLEDQWMCYELQKRMEYSQVKERLLKWARNTNEFSRSLQVDISGPYRSAREFLEDLEWPADLHSELFWETRPPRMSGILTNADGIKCRLCSFPWPFKPFANVWTFEFAKILDWF